MRRITRPLLILLAIVFLIEAWLWRHLGPIVEWIVAWLPLRAVKARLAGIIRKLPPAATLVVFVVPVVVLFPLKVLGLWLLAHKHWIAASGVLVFAKLVGLAVTAFVFEVTRPKLLQLRWFRWLYEHVLVWLDWAHRAGRADQAADQETAPHLPRRSGRDARCGCCGASAAACAPIAQAPAFRSVQMQQRAARTAQTP